jgi:putative ABC transport system ATP-binding protein
MTTTRPDAREPAAAAAVELRGVTKIYDGAAGPVPALRGVDAAFATGTFTAVMGASGSGKSTLLHCAAGLDTATSGDVLVAGVDLRGRDERELTLIRRRHVGFVFQAYNLVSSLTVAQNLELGFRLAGRRAPVGAVESALERVGLSGCAARRPDRLSGGQQQRVAIARALVTEPAVLFADEPTGALDVTTSREVLDLLRRSVDDAGRTVVLVTHDPVVAARADRVVFLADGRITGELAGHPLDPSEIATRITALDASCRP